MLIFEWVWFLFVISRDTFFKTLSYIFAPRIVLWVSFNPSRLTTISLTQFVDIILLIFPFDNITPFVLIPTAIFFEAIYSSKSKNRGVYRGSPPSNCICEILFMAHWSIIAHFSSYEVSVPCVLHLSAAFIQNEHFKKHLLVISHLISFKNIIYIASSIWKNTYYEYSIFIKTLINFFQKFFWIINKLQN